MEELPNQPKKALIIDPWLKTKWGVILGLIFLPLTLSYIVIRQKRPVWMKILGIFVIWTFTFIVGGSAGKKSTETTNSSEQATTSNVQTPTPVPTPEKVEYSLEQKQNDFKTFYDQYQKQKAGVVMVQTTLLQIANKSTDKAELYLALDKLSNMQKSISSGTNDIKVPDSLKEYKDLDAAVMELAVAGRHFSNAIDQFMEYLNKNDLSKLKEAKNRSDLGVEQLTSSSDKVEVVAKQLNIDTSTLKKNQ